MAAWHSLGQLILARIREFHREPIVIFWVYGFPILLAVGLGAAFWNREPEPLKVDVAEFPELLDKAKALQERLNADGLQAELHSSEECRQRYLTGKTAFCVEPTTKGYRYIFDPTRQESVLARARVDLIVERIAADIQQEDATSSGEKLADEVTQHWKINGKTWETTNSIVKEPGNRYIDFLLPGLIGMNLMGGGFWGVGFVLVEMRVRKLLKRLLATPMRRDFFMMSILGSRMIFLLPEMACLLLLGWLGFGIPIKGSLFVLFITIFLGAVAFSGLGLLISCRTSKIETVSGLMNLCMLPQWLMSGIFFSSKRFPDVMQPFVQALPLTQLNNALREIMLEGASLTAVSWRLLILLGYGVVSFFLALRWFRWQ